MPATIAVANTNDSGAGSLRAAIEQANLDPARDTIALAPSITGTITLSSALPDLSTDLTVDGPGAAVLTVARGDAPGTAAFRIFTVAAGAEVTISGLTITGGRVFGGSNSVGGGISNSGTLTVSNSTLSGNSTYRVSGPGSGGGINNSGALTVISSTFSGNSASGFVPVGRSGFERGNGGGIANSGTLTLSNSTLSGNSATNGSGGGIDNSGTLTVTNSTLSGNSATRAGVGGGIANRDGGKATATTTLFANPVGGNLVSQAGAAFVSLGKNLFSDAPGVALDPTDLVNTDRQGIPWNPPGRRSDRQSAPGGRAVG